jgi:hypothetical protein
MFGLGAVAGYFTSKKMLEKQYRMDVADIQAWYKEKLDELGVMEEGFVPPDDFDEPEDEDGDDEDEDPEDEEEAKRRDALASYRGDKRRVVIDYTKPSLASIRNKLREGASVVVGANGD